MTRQDIEEQVKAFQAAGGKVIVVPPKQRRKRASKAKVGHWERAKIKRASKVDKTAEMVPATPHHKGASHIQCSSPGHARQLAGTLADEGHRVSVKGRVVHVVARVHGSRKAIDKALKEAQERREAEQWSKAKASAQISAELGKLLED